MSPFVSSRTAGGSFFLRKRATDRGFTLIELMIVIAVVAILAAIAIPAYNDQVRKSRRGQAKADLVELAQILERRHTTSNSYEDTPALPFTTSPRAGTTHYTIAPVLAANTFTLTATPSSSSQSADTCGTLSINQAGRRTHSAGTAAQCEFGGPP